MAPQLRRNYGNVGETMEHNWTGATAMALRKALRMTERGFADRLGVSARSVCYWGMHPGMVPRVQDELDRLFAESTPAVKARFGEMVAGQSPVMTGSAQALRVAIAVVVHGDRVLLVRRRNESAGISWQFAAGIVKPGEAAEDVAVREALAETGVHCSVSRRIGGRLHPVTGVMCDYFLCAYLAGEASNLDTVENAAVAWAPRREVTRFIRQGIYPPVLLALEAGQLVS